MSRSVSTAAVFLALAAWAGAQGPPPPLSAADQLRLLRANRSLLNDLVDRGVELADAHSPLDRADAGRRTAQTLSRAAAQAADDRDPDRAAEVGDHLDAFLRDGLLPTFAEARRLIPDGSPDAARLRAVEAAAAKDVEGARAALSAPGKVGDNARVKAARGRLGEARDRLAPPAGR